MRLSMMLMLWLFNLLMSVRLLMMLLVLMVFLVLFWLMVLQWIVVHFYLFMVLVCLGSWMVFFLMNWRFNFWLFFFLVRVLLLLRHLMMRCFLLHLFLLWLMMLMMLMLLVMLMLFVVFVMLMMLFLMRFLMRYIFMIFNMNWCRLLLLMMFSCILLRRLLYSVLLVMLSCGLFWLIFCSVEHQSFRDLRGRFAGVQGNLNELGLFFVLEVLLRQSLMSIILWLPLLCLRIFLDVLRLGLHNPDFRRVLSLVVVLLLRLDGLVVFQFLGSLRLCGRVGHDAFAIGGLILALAVLCLISVHDLLRQLLH